MNNETVCRCNVCSEEIQFHKSQDGQSASCPYCGMDTILFAPRIPIEKKAIQSTIRLPGLFLNRTCYVICGAIALMLLIAAASLQGNGSHQMDARETATEMSMLIISNSLVAPTTAKFSGIGFEQKPDGIIFVTGDVDAQNSFGAMLRQSWMCILTNENSQKMEYVGFTIGDQTVMNPDFGKK